MKFIYISALSYHTMSVSVFFYHTNIMITWLFSQLGHLYGQKILPLKPPSNQDVSFQNCITIFMWSGVLLSQLCSKLTTSNTIQQSDLQSAPPQWQRELSHYQQHIQSDNIIIHTILLDHKPCSDVSARWWRTRPNTACTWWHEHQEPRGEPWSPKQSPCPARMSGNRNIV